MDAHITAPRNVDRTGALSSPPRSSPGEPSSAFALCRSSARSSGSPLADMFYPDMYEKYYTIQGENSKDGIYVGRDGNLQSQRNVGCSKDDKC